jgi:hypothetical protein
MQIEAIFSCRVSKEMRFFAQFKLRLAIPFMYDSRICTAASFTLAHHVTVSEAQLVANDYSPLLFAFLLTPTA